MTNEEKAMEIAECCSVMPPTPITQSDVLAMTNNAAMQAMEWKDKQHKQEKQRWIGEACERIENFLAPDGSIVPENIWLLRGLKQAIKEEI